MRSLIQASDTVFSNPSAYKGTIKPGWSDYVAECYNAYNEVARLWRNAGKPRNGDIFELRRVSLQLLKSLKPALTQPLRLITNQILTTGIFPEKLKIAKVVPIYKMGENTQLCNYRPISLLPAISKVIEKIMYSQLDNFFKTQRHLYDNQYGFRTEHSTEFAALEFRRQSNN